MPSNKTINIDGVGLVVLEDELFIITAYCKQKDYILHSQSVDDLI